MQDFRSAIRPWFLPVLAPICCDSGIWGGEKVSSAFPFSFRGLKSFDMRTIYAIIGKTLQVRALARNRNLMIGRWRPSRILSRMDWSLPIID